MYWKCKINLEVQAHLQSYSVFEVSLGHGTLVQTNAHKTGDDKIYLFRGIVKEFKEEPALGFALWKKECSQKEAPPDLPMVVCPGDIVNVVLDTEILLSVMSRDWRIGLAVKSISRGLKFSSHHPHRVV